MPQTARTNLWTNSTEFTIALKEKTQSGGGSIKLSNQKMKNL